MARTVPVFHITARLRRGSPPLTDAANGPWLWGHLRDVFRDAYGACLMPDHPHVASPGDPDDLQHRMAQVLGFYAKRHRLGRGAVEVSVTGPVKDSTKLLRLVRYIDLNAPREGLTNDPLTWEWSTHRDVMGAIVDPWVTAERLAGALHRRTSGFTDWYHRYVSADPSVAVDGTPSPSPAGPAALPHVPLQRIVEAVQAALRCPADAVRRRGPARHLFVLLATEQGWTDRGRLAAVCQCSPRTVGELIRRPQESLLPAARLCLGDPRLTQAPRNGRIRRFQRPCVAQAG